MQLLEDWGTFLWLQANSQVTENYIKLLGGARVGKAHPPMTACSSRMCALQVNTGKEAQVIGKKRQCIIYRNRRME